MKARKGIGGEKEGGKEGEVALSLRSVMDGAEQEPDVRETEEE